MEKRYYTNINFNLTKLLTHLNSVVENNGGEIVCRKGYNSYKKEYEIHNRTVLNSIQECEIEIEKIKQYAPSENEKINEMRKRRLKNLEGQISELKKTEPEPFTTHFLQSITFVLDGKMYYFSTDENPFFPFHYQKTDINEKMETKGTYLEDFSKKDWMYDCLFDIETSEADLREIACILFNKLVSAEDTEVYYEVEYKYCPCCGRRQKYNKAAKIITYEKVTF